MADIRTTTTNYLHPTDPNLLNIHKAMKFNSDGEPVVRTHVDGISLQGDVIVDTVSLSSSTLAALETVNVVQSSTPWVITGSVVVSNFPTTATVYQGTNPWVVTGNINVANTQTDVVLADSNYEMNVARGLVPGHSVMTRSAYNPSVPADTLSSVWVEGGIYPFTTWTTASRLYVASSSASDTGQQILIEGLNSNYVYQSETITTNGTTAVQTTGTYIRIWTGTITSSSVANTNAGEIRFRITSASGTVVAHIRATIGQTKLSQFTVPANTTAYVMYGDMSSFKTGNGQISTTVQMDIRPFGGAFFAGFIAVAGNGYYRNDFKVPLVLPAKADVDVRVLCDSASAVSANWQMILIQN
jgi:hypothetical protein